MEKDMNQYLSKAEVLIEAPALYSAIQPQDYRDQIRRQCDDE